MRRIRDHEHRRRVGELQIGAELLSGIDVALDYHAGDRAPQREVLVHRVTGSPVEFHARFGATKLGLRPRIVGLGGAQVLLGSDPGVEQLVQAIQVFLRQ